jgi:hypothetical protein
MKFLQLLPFCSVIFCLGCAKKTTFNPLANDLHWENPSIEVAMLQNSPTAPHDIVAQGDVNETKVHFPLAASVKRVGNSPFVKTALQSRQDYAQLKDKEYPRKANPFEVVVIFLGLMIIVGLLILAIIAFGFLALFILAGLLGFALFRSIFPKKMKIKDKEV